MIDAVAATAWYVYAFVGPSGEDIEAALAQSAGVASTPLRVVGGPDVAAVVGEVSLAEFGEDVLPSRLNDRAWLEEKARAHEDVLERLAAVTTVVPLRFGALFDDVAAVERALAERRPELEAALERVRGRVELGVQAWVTRTTSAPAPQATSGRAYLQQKQQQRRSTEATSLELQEVIAEAHERLRTLADDAVVNRPQPKELTGRADDMVLNAAYLVPAGDERLARAVVELDGLHRARGLTFELTGPWPAHNFASERDGR